LPHWPLYSPPAPATLVFDDTTAAVRDLRKPQLQVWYDKWSHDAQR